MIKINKLSYRYDNSDVLRNISLNIAEGDYLAVIGANGSGKTTLIKHLNSLLLPTKGDILVDDINTKKDSWEIRKKVGMVFQNSEDQLVTSIVEEDIAFGLENLGIPTNEIKARVNGALKRLCIGHLAKKNVNMLSFGQKQLVALAGVIVMKPKYIVFDEPTTMLDPKNKKNILSIIIDLNKKEGITIILVTNVLADLKNAKKIVALKDGKIIFSGNKPKLKSTILKKAGLYA